MHVCIFVHVGKWKKIGGEKQKEKSRGDCDREALII